MYPESWFQHPDSPNSDHTFRLVLLGGIYFNVLLMINSYIFLNCIPYLLFSMISVEIKCWLRRTGRLLVAQVLCLRRRSFHKTFIFFVNANKNLTESLDTRRSCSLWSAGFPYDSRLQRDPKSVATILNSTQQRYCVFVTSFRALYLVQLASDKPFNYPSGW